MRILSIDYGKKRTGIAVTDPAQIIANGLVTVDTHELLRFLKEYTAKESVERFVIGLPTQPDGTPSENQKRVLVFTEKLKKMLPEIPIDFYDERFTSVLANRAASFCRIIWKVANCFHKPIRIRTASGNKYTGLVSFYNSVIITSANY